MTPTRLPLRLPRPNAFSSLIRRSLALLVALFLLLAPQPALASLTTNSYDGNIYALYAGNGSLVPPRSTLAQARADHRPVVLVFYLDDSADSKQFAPVLSELQRLWGRTVELIPLTTDPLQGLVDQGPDDPVHYWNGTIPQVVVFDGDGKVLLDANGQVNTTTISAVLSKATGLDPAGGERATSTRSFNELNSEVVSGS